VLYLASIQTTSVFEGSRELLVELKDRGWRIVLAARQHLQDTPLGRQEDDALSGAAA
jgi:hypothetical protein